MAIMLRSIRTRFFGHGLGFLVSIGWPFVHIVLLLLINSFFSRAAPYGDSLVVFFTTGLIPFMVFQYMARFIMITVLHTRPLLAFPTVKIPDLLFAGAILEVLSSCITVIVLGIVLAVLGYDIWPVDPIVAAQAFAVSLLLGLGCGILSGLLVMAMPMAAVGQGLLMIFLYLISGIFFLPTALPADLRYYLAFNPVLQAVEWMRAAYYDGYGSVLDKTYAVSFAVVLVFVGLAIERLFRGRFLIMR
jgi:capsular polysaccharide transport system permease protein